MWSTRSEPLTNGRVLKIFVRLDAAPVSFREVLRRWQYDDAFRAFFIELLADAPFSAFRWETPPISASTADRPFEFVLLDSPGLAREPDADAFADFFVDAEANKNVVSFLNLGKDAILVVPCPCSEQSAYGHLAAFVREAADPQKHELWKRVGMTVEEKLGPARAWLNTAGAGVSWLHVRIDQRPKYYGYAPYREDG